MPVEENLMQAILLTFGTAMVPVLELRGAIPVGVAAGLSPAAACLVSILGNMVPVPSSDWLTIPLSYWVCSPCWPDSCLSLWRSTRPLLQPS